MDIYYFDAYPSSEAGTSLMNSAVTIDASRWHEGSLYLHVSDKGSTAAVHIPRKELMKFVEAAEEFLDETAPTLPDRPFAVIKANLTDGREGVELVLADKGDDLPWQGEDGWSSDGEIVSFEVLYEGLGTDSDD